MVAFVVFWLLGPGLRRLSAVVPGPTRSPLTGRARLAARRSRSDTARRKSITTARIANRHSSFRSQWRRGRAIAGGHALSPDSSRRH